MFLGNVSIFISVSKQHMNGSGRASVTDGMWPPQMMRCLSSIEFNVFYDQTDIY